MSQYDYLIKKDPPVYANKYGQLYQQETLDQQLSNKYVYGYNSGKYNHNDLIPTYKQKRVIYGVQIPDQVYWEYSHSTMATTLILSLVHDGLVYKSEFMVTDQMMTVAETPDMIIDDIIRKLWIYGMNQILNATLNTKIVKTKINPVTEIGIFASKKDYPVENVFGLIPDLKSVVGYGEKSIMMVRVSCPTKDEEQNEFYCGKGQDYLGTVYDVIQHLNDHHRWPRETLIADWLDKLHDEGIIDITIEIPDPPMEAK
jgi:hypothetical protein